MTATECRKSAEPDLAICNRQGVVRSAPCKAEHGKSASAGFAINDTVLPGPPLSMPIRPCSESILQGCDLVLRVIVPSRRPEDEEYRYHCLVDSCPYIGATLHHPSDCLKHLLDPKHKTVEHKALWDDSLFCFRSLESKPVLHSKPDVASAFAFFQEGSQKTQHAYMKVCTRHAALRPVCIIDIGVCVCVCV